MRYDILAPIALFVGFYLLSRAFYQTISIFIQFVFYLKTHGPNEKVKYSFNSSMWFATIGLSLVSMSVVFYLSHFLKLPI
jgi:hypothetical protein